MASNKTVADVDITGLMSTGTNSVVYQYHPNINEAGDTYVAWNWKAGGSAVTNTAGSISSQVSANPTAGFSIVTYTGTGSNATVGHGLGVAPKMIIVKGRSNVDNWQVYHSDLTSASYRILLNSNAAATSQPAVWNSTAPTSSVFSLGTGVSVNQSGETFVAYCWAEIAGFSSFGSYAGNGLTNGPFVYTGFRPKFVLIKRTITTGSSWFIMDSTRSTTNVTTLGLSPDTAGVEFTGSSTTIPFYDILSNGFKVRGTSTGMNSASDTYIYAAFAENPFKNSLAR
jgi:hypothetical protein